MSSEHENLNPREERVRDLVKGLSNPTADDAFRQALKAQFVAGTIPERPETRHPRSAQRIRWFGVAAPLAAAAVLLLMLGILNRGSGWSLLEGEGRVTIDGVAVSLNDPEAVESLLRSGARVELDADSRAWFLQGERVLAELNPGSRVTLPNAPGRWWGKNMVGSVQAGVTRWVTGSEFPGHRLTLTTPESTVEVTGTSFSVMCSEGGTCICVLEGEIMVIDPIGGSDMVQGGHRKTMFRDGEAPDYGDMLDRERVALTELSLRIDRETGDRGEAEQ